MRDGKEGFEECLKGTHSGRSIIGRVYTKVNYLGIRYFKIISTPKSIGDSSGNLQGTSTLLKRLYGTLLIKLIN